MISCRRRESIPPLRFALLDDRHRVSGSRAGVHVTGQVPQGDDVEPFVAQKFQILLEQRRRRMESAREEGELAALQRCLSQS